VAERKVAQEMVTALPAAERLANLEKFLSKSYIKDPVYHATPKDITVFKPGGDDPTMSGRAIWTTTSKTNQPAQHNIGSKTAKYREGVNVMPLHGRAERPLLLDDPDMVGWAQDVFAGGSREFPELLPDKWLKEVKEAGYDSVILADPHKRGDPHEVIFFEPNQLKSALSNRGTYDINEAEIMKADGGLVYRADGGYVAPTNPFGRQASKQKKMREEQGLTPAGALLRGMGETKFGDLTNAMGERDYSVMDPASNAKPGREAEMQSYQDLGGAIGIGSDLLPFLAMFRGAGKTAQSSKEMLEGLKQRGIDRDRTWIRAKKEHDEGAPPAGTTLSRQPGDRKITKGNTKGGVWLTELMKTTESPEVANSYMGKTGYAIPVHSQKPDLVLDAKGQFWGDYFDDVGPKATFSNAEWEEAKANPNIRAIEIRNVFDPGGKHGGFPVDMPEEEMRKALTTNNLFLKKPFEGNVVSKYTDEPFEYRTGGYVTRADGSPKQGETAPAPRLTDLEKLKDESKQYSQYNDLMDFLASRQAVPEITQTYLGPSTGGEFTSGWGAPKNGKIEVNWGATPSTLVHELTHAADRQISHQASDLEERHRKETPIFDYIRGKTVLTPEEVRLAMGYRKLHYNPNKDYGDPARYPRQQLINKMAPEWSKKNYDYRSGDGELVAYGMGSTVPRRGYRAPLHVDPTMATEFSILLDLAQRAQKAKPPIKE
jgi:hypothetical protein